MAAFPFDLSAFAILNDELAEQGVNPQYAAPAHVAARAPDPVIHVVPATGPSPGVDFDTWWDALESEFTLEKRRYDDLADAILREHGAPTPRQLAPRLLPLLLKWHRLLREQWDLMDADPAHEFDGSHLPWNTLSPEGGLDFDLETAIAPEYQGVIWTIDPLTSDGRCTVVRWGSPQDHTEIRLSKMKALFREQWERGNHYADLGIVFEFVVRGLSLGTKAKPRVKLSFNHQPFWANREIALKKFSEKRQNFAIPRFTKPTATMSQLPGELHASSFCLTQRDEEGKIKPRLTTDLSQDGNLPRELNRVGKKRTFEQVLTGNDGRQYVDTSQNAMVDQTCPQHFPQPLKYMRLRDLHRGAAILNSAGRDLIQSREDAVAYYEQNARDVREHHLVQQWLVKTGPVLNPRQVFGAVRECASGNRINISWTWLIDARLADAQARVEAGLLRHLRRALRRAELHAAAPAAAAAAATLLPGHTAGTTINILIFPACWYCALKLFPRYKYRYRWEYAGLRTKGAYEGLQVLNIIRIFPAAADINIDPLKPLLILIFTPPRIARAATTAAVAATRQDASDNTTGPANTSSLAARDVPCVRELLDDCSHNDLISTSTTPLCPAERAVVNSLSLSEAHSLLHWTALRRWLGYSGQWCYQGTFFDDTGAVCLDFWDGIVRREQFHIWRDELNVQIADGSLNPFTGANFGNKEERVGPGQHFTLLGRRSDTRAPGVRSFDVAKRQRYTALGRGLLQDARTLQDTPIKRKRKNGSQLYRQPSLPTASVQQLKGQLGFLAEDDPLLRACWQEFLSALRPGWESRQHVVLTPKAQSIIEHMLWLLAQEHGVAFMPRPLDFSPSCHSLWVGAGDAARVVDRADRAHRYAGFGAWFLRRYTRHVYYYFDALSADEQDCHSTAGELFNLNVLAAVAGPRMNSPAAAGRDRAVTALEPYTLVSACDNHSAGADSANSSHASSSEQRTLIRQRTKILRRAGLRAPCVHVARQHLPIKAADDLSRALDADFRAKLRCLFDDPHLHFERIDIPAATRGALLEARAAGLYTARLRGERGKPSAPAVY